MIHRPIRLRKEGKYTIVEIEVKLKGTFVFIEVIRELSDNNFDHIVNSAGISRAIEEFSL